MEWVVLAAAVVLAFANGANDNPKGVATLYGSGALGYRGSLALATVSTALGALVSVVAAATLVRAFSGKGLVPSEALTPGYLASVGLAASTTVLLATRIGMPISTTHAIVGGLAGAGFVAAGSALDLGALGGVFLLPLLFGPLVAVGVALLLSRSGGRLARRLGVRAETCVCVGGEWRPVEVEPQSGGAAVVRRAAPALAVEVGEAPACEERYTGRVAGVTVQQFVDLGHLASASLVGFARGLNDTPKILGLVVGLGVVSAPAGAAVLALAMALGGLVAARRVGETLAKHITPMTPAQGLAGNLSTSLLVVGASRLGRPVSTTHVSTGGIFGIGAASGGLRRRMASRIVGAWVLTLPLSALIAASLMGALS